MVDIQPRRFIDLRILLPRGFDIRDFCNANFSFLPKCPIFKLNGLVPHVPDISTVGKEPKGTLYLCFWLLHSSKLQGFGFIVDLFT